MVEITVAKINSAKSKYQHKVEFQLLTSLAALFYFWGY